MGGRQWRRRCLSQGSHRAINELHPTCTWHGQNSLWPPHPPSSQGGFWSPPGPAGAGTKSQGLITAVSRHLEVPGSCVCAHQDRWAKISRMLMKDSGASLVKFNWEKPDSVPDCTVCWLLLKKSTDKLVVCVCLFLFFFLSFPLCLPPTSFPQLLPWAAS